MSHLTHRRSGFADWRDEDFPDKSEYSDSRRRVRERKTAQLCAQAQRALGMVVQNELNDAKLSGLVVVEVRPHPDASCLLVEVSAPDECDLQACKDSLERAAGRLRAALARTMSRKKVPLIRFNVIPGEIHDHA